MGTSKAQNLFPVRIESVDFGTEVRPLQIDVVWSADINSGIALWRRAHPEFKGAVCAMVDGAQPGEFGSVWTARFFRP